MYAVSGFWQVIIGVGLGILLVVLIDGCCCYLNVDGIVLNVYFIRLLCIGFWHTFSNVYFRNAGTWRFILRVSRKLGVTVL